MPEVPDEPDELGGNPLLFRSPSATEAETPPLGASMEKTAMDDKTHSLHRPTSFLLFTHWSSRLGGLPWFAPALLLFGLLLYLGPRPLEAQFPGSLQGKIVCPGDRCLTGVELTLEPLQGTAKQREAQQKEASQQKALRQRIMQLNPRFDQEVKPDREGYFSYGPLPSGQYQLTARHADFAEVKREVSVIAGLPRLVVIEMGLTLDEVIVVTSEPPIGQVATGEAGNWTGREELNRIPVGSDPWSSGEHSAGVYGNRSSANLAVADADTVVAHEGAGKEETTVLVDGVPLDVGGPGGPGHLLATEQLAGVEIVTGGNDIRRASAGALVNLVTHAPSDKLQAQAHATHANRDWQSSGTSVVAVPTSSSEGTGGADSPLEIFSLGNPQSDSLELGGFASGRLPGGKVGGFLSLRQWSYQQQAFGGGQEDDSILSLGAKVDINPLKSTSTALSYFRGDRESEGVGAAPDRSQESTLLATEPSRLLKIEQQIVFGPKSVLAGRYSSLRNGHVGSPLGGTEEDIVLGASGVWSGSFLSQREDQSSDNLQLQSFFYGTPRQRQHEIEIGASQRQLESSSFVSWGANNRILVDGINLGLPLLDLVQLYRDSETRVAQDFDSLWIQDRATFHRWRVDTALRYDLQRGRNLASRVEANPLAPELLPAVDFAGSRAGFSWSTLSPRLSLTYGLGPQNRTVLRASYGQFASVLYSDLISHSSPTVGGAVTLSMEEGQSGGASEVRIIDLRAPDARYSALGLSPSSTDPNLDPEKTQEIRLSAEHQLGRHWVVDLALTQREITNVLETRRLVREASGNERLATRGDYILEQSLGVTLPEGDNLDVPIYRLADGLEFTGGSVLTNGDRSQSYEALTLSVRRRLAGRWMLRGYVHWSDWRWRVGPAFQSFDDPTDNAAIGTIEGVAPNDTNGEVVSQPGVAAPYSSPLLLNSRWSFQLQGLYRVAPEKRWGFDVSASLYGRQGYPLPYLVTVPSVDLTVREVQATVTSDSVRLEDIQTLDIRLEKDLNLRNTRATLSLDAFNLMNADTVLDRDRRLNGPRANVPREVLSPRTLRLGLRLALD